MSIDQLQRYAEQPAWRWVLGAVAVIALLVFAGRTLDQMDATVSSSSRATASDLRDVYRCLGAKLSHLPADETYWFGPETADAGREIWRQRLVQRSFPHVHLADRKADATVLVGLEAARRHDRGCGGLRLVRTPGPRAG